MRTWLKGGILLAIVYILVQFIDDFFGVFFNINPLEKVRYILYLDFLEFFNIHLQESVVGCGTCEAIYILIVGFALGCIIGAIVQMLSKEKEKEIKSEVEDSMKDFKWKSEPTKDLKPKSETVKDEPEEDIEEQIKKGTYEESIITKNILEEENKPKVKKKAGKKNIKKASKNKAKGRKKAKKR
jgi:hypothetical protein